MTDDGAVAGGDAPGRPHSHQDDLKERLQEARRELERIEKKIGRFDDGPEFVEGSTAGTWKESSRLYS